MHTVQDLQRYYFPNTYPQSLVDTVEEQHLVSGHVAGVVGNLVVYEAASRFWMSALKKLDLCPVNLCVRGH